MHSRVTCGHAVKVAGPKGLIVGGQTIACDEITAAVIGSGFGTSTELIVGYQINLWDQISDIERQLKEFAFTLDRTQKDLTHLKKLHAQLGGSLPPDKAELHKWLIRNVIKLTSEIKMLTQNKLELEAKQREFLEENIVPRVNCNYVIYPGVKVTINRSYRSFTEEQKYCTLIDWEGEVSVSALGYKPKTAPKPA
jgi:uncharacterized protein (DUF342 family)